ncbi:transcriptional regulator GutM [Shouchella shacheensis]|uniref:transcriptional regulator GutM n=1 Tax=Shouchella shacheensis TaxID=1649580 RepID=UPI00073FDA63|nr:transcriptional regulator GutM [Shouchella shacheensis]
MTILIVALCLGLGFLLQSVLGFWQMKNFNQQYTLMRSEGKVAIGRSRGFIRTGVVLLLSVDKQANIVRAEKMQGLTIFARFKPVDALANQPLFRTSPEVEGKLDRFSKKALDDARHVYRIVQAGGEVPKPKAPLEKVVTMFTKKREVKQ